MKLEGVDPEHQSMYCVLTVAEVSRAEAEPKQQQLEGLIPA